MSNDTYSEIYEFQDDLLNGKQEKIKSTSVCIAGLGGVGSALFQMLIHLGVRKITVIDYDTIELTNLTRFVGAKISDAGKNKTSVLEKYGNTVFGVDVKIICKKISDDTFGEIFDGLDVDFVFGALDELLPRQYVNQFIVRKKIPYVDCGMVVEKENNSITTLRGQTIFIKPGEPCLRCKGNVDDNLGYGNHTAPFVHLNMIIASMAVTQFCNYIIGIGSDAVFLEYDALASKLNPREFCNMPERCNLCKNN